MALAPTDVAAVLADPTRFAIYDKLAQNRLRSYTVQEIAQQFRLHPNVARTHLSRLEEIGLVDSVLEKSGRGGRPGKRYAASDRPVTLQFPRRDWEFLARLLVRTVEALGPEAVQKARDLAYEEGFRRGRQAARSPAIHRETSPPPAGRDGWLSGVALEAVREQLRQDAGVQELWQRQDGALGMRFTTCVFRELAVDFGDSVCELHRAYLRGLVDGLLGPVNLTQQASLIRDGAPSCEYTLTPAAAAPASRTA